MNLDCDAAGRQSADSTANTTGGTATGLPLSLLLQNVGNHRLGEFGPRLIGMGDGYGPNSWVVSIGCLGNLNIGTRPVLDHFNLGSASSDDQTNVSVGYLYGGGWQSRGRGCCKEGKVVLGERRGIVA